MKIFIGCSSCEEIPKIYFESCSEFLNEVLKDNELVFGACNSGLMGIAYNTALNLNSNIIGICPDRYKEDFNLMKCNKEIITNTVNERTDKLIKESDALIFLPGGIGTIYELLTAIECKRCHEFDKPIIIYNANGYYDSLLEFIDKMFNENFIRKKGMPNYIVSNDTKEIICFLNNTVDKLKLTINS